MRTAKAKTWLAAAGVGAVLGAAGGVTAAVILMQVHPVGSKSVPGAACLGALTGAVAGLFAHRRAWLGAALSGGISTLTVWGLLYLAEAMLASRTPGRAAMVAKALVLLPLCASGAFALYPTIWSRLSPRLHAD